MSLVVYPPIAEVAAFDELKKAVATAHADLINSQVKKLTITDAMKCALLKSLSLESHQKFTPL